MKIGLVSSAVPLVRGGGRFIVEWLREELDRRGHLVETVYIPGGSDPGALLREMTAFRLVNLDDHFDRVITFRPPAQAIRHRKKVVWFIHHMRVLYDLWDSPYRIFPDRAPAQSLRSAVVRADTAVLREAHRVFTNSKIVRDRLHRFNNVESEVLYPPVLRPERFRVGSYGDEIVCVCRVEHHKRQHLLIDAMNHVRSGVRLRLSGITENESYATSLREAVVRQGLADRVTVENRWITEDEKVARLEHALACAYVPLDEDSYGYPTLEAAHACRSTVTVADAGGVLEFVRDRETGLVVEPDPHALAEAFDRLYADRPLAARLGLGAAVQVSVLGIDWDHVVERLLS